MDASDLPYYISRSYMTGFMDQTEYVEVLIRTQGSAIF